MICFWVLHLNHQSGQHTKSVYVNINTLMQYWGHMLTDHSKLQGTSIEQKEVYCDDEPEHVFMVEWFDADSQRYDHEFLAGGQALRDHLEWHENHGRKPTIETYSVIYD